MGIICEDKGIPYYIAKHEYDRSDIIMWLERCAGWVVDNISQSFENIFSFWEKLINKHCDKKITAKNRILEKRRLKNILMESKKYYNNLEKWVQFLINNLELCDMLNKSIIYPDEVENIDKFIKVIKGNWYSNRNIGSFAKIGKHENQITITTRHSSKGLSLKLLLY